MFCSTTRIVVPLSATLRIASKICMTSFGAMPRLGSSSKRSEGRAIIARPIASICCSPPERVPASCFTRSARRGKSATTSASVSFIAVASRWPHAPSSRFSRTVRLGNTPRPSGTSETPASVTSSVERGIRLTPSSSIAPLTLVPGSRARVRRVVVFPAPLAPMRATISPRRTSSETPFSASMPP